MAIQIRCDFFYLPNRLCSEASFLVPGPCISETGDGWEEILHISNLRVICARSYCSYCSWGAQGKNTEVVWHSLLQWTTFCQTSPQWPVCLGWPHTAWLSFIELDKVVVCVIRLATCLWLWFQHICPLMRSLSAYHLNWVSLTLGVGYLYMAAAPDLGRGELPLATPAPHRGCSHRKAMPKYAQTTIQLYSSHTLLK